ncbi:MAG: glycine-rich domain-containing protein-like [Pseudomonadota bacterium]
MNTENHFAPIAALDLDPIKVKLMHQESGEGWSREYADAIEFEYRRFLYLMKKFPHEQAAPLFDVDIFWHYHILDTMKYAEDCHAVYGYFLHHFPYVGLRGEQDMEVHHQVGERMRELYEQTYGEAYIREHVPAHAPVAGTAAFSMTAGRAAFSMNAATFAFSMNGAKTAFSMQAGKVAFSMNGGKVAWSQDTDTATNDTLAQVAAANFNSSRPTLGRAV